jgi:hypothetical protein
MPSLGVLLGRNVARATLLPPGVDIQRRPRRAPDHQGGPVMGLLSKALAVGVGYALAQPEVRRKIVAFVQHPKVKQGRDQVQDLAANGVRTAKHQLGRSKTTDTPAVESAPTPLYAGVPTPSPSPRASDPATLRQGVLPPAEDSGATTALKDS